MPPKVFFCPQHKKYFFLSEKTKKNPENIYIQVAVVRQLKLTNRLSKWLQIDLIFIE